MKEVEHLDKELFPYWTKGRVHDSNAAVLAVNALGFHDPGAEGSAGQGHLGTHPANITCFMRDVDSRKYLNTLCRAVADALRTCKKDVLEILVFCKSGRHRSVALAACFQKALASDSRVDGLPYLEHLSKQAWKHMRGWCGDCAQCNGYDAQTQIHNIAEFMKRFMLID